MKRLMILTSLLALCLAGCGDTSAVDRIANGETQAQTRAPAQEVTEDSGDYLSYFLDDSAEDAQVPQLAQDEEGAITDRSSYPSPDPDGEFDIDLTTMSSSIVYATVNDMVTYPDDYVGKTVKMKGPFGYYQDEATGKEYFAAIIVDATACCSQGIEFETAQALSYPADYPELDSEITVVGVFDYYREDYMLYCRLINAQIV